jgi:RNA polymerase subunit RPABC4/transcription elongation factor Spt4
MSTIRSFFTLGPQQCPVCLDAIRFDNIALTPCAHAVCNKCAYDLLMNGTTNCPMCRAKLHAHSFLIYSEMLRSDFAARLSTLVSRHSELGRG